jgi:hypothetical protein
MDVLRLGLIGTTGCGKTVLLVRLLEALTDAEWPTEFDMSEGVRRQHELEAKHEPTKPTTLGKSDDVREWVRFRGRSGHVIVVQAFAGEVIKKPGGGLDSKGLREAFDAATCGMIVAVNPFLTSALLAERAILQFIERLCARGCDLVSAVRTATYEMFGSVALSPSIVRELDAIESLGTGMGRRPTLVCQPAGDGGIGFEVREGDSPARTELVRLICEHAQTCHGLAKLNHRALAEAMQGCSLPVAVALTRLDLVSMAPVLTGQEIDSILKKFWGDRVHDPRVHDVRAKSYETSVFGAAGVARRSDPSSGHDLLSTVQWLALESMRVPKPGGASHGR